MYCQKEEPNSIWQTLFTRLWHTARITLYFFIKTHLKLLQDEFKFELHQIFVKSILNIFFKAVLILLDL